MDLLSACCVPGPVLDTLHLFYPLSLRAVLCGRYQMRLTNEETGSERLSNFLEVAVRGGSGNLGLLPSEPSIHWFSFPSAESGELAHCMVGRLSTPREHRGRCGEWSALQLACSTGAPGCLFRRPWPALVEVIRA